MTCETVKFPNGVTAIVCSRGKRASRIPCSACKWRPHTRLCDFPLRGGRAGETCSARLCDVCAHRRGELDLCAPHSRAHEQLALPTSGDEP